jgi:hypothetical protein
MAVRGLVDGWTVVREYHPELDPDGSLCGSALADLYTGLKAREIADAGQGEAPGSRVPGASTRVDRRAGEPHRVAL